VQIRQPGFKKFVAGLSGMNSAGRQNLRHQCRTGHFPNESGHQSLIVRRKPPLSRHFSSCESGGRFSV
jgi:hypothetical protein